MFEQSLVFLNTRLRAAIAVVMTALLTYSNAHALFQRQTPFTLVGGGALPSWLAIALTIALYVTAFAMSILLILAPLRKDEKAVALGLVLSLTILPIAALSPAAAQVVRCLQLALNAVAVLAALAILLSNFWLRHA